MPYGIPTPLASEGKSWSRTAMGCWHHLWPGLMKRSNQFPAFGINTDHRKTIVRVDFYPGADIAKLLIALVRTWWIPYPRFKAFQVFAKRVIHFLKQPAHRFGRNANAHAFELPGNLAVGFARPLTPADRIPGGLVFHYFRDRVHDLRCFFSCEGRPAPGARSLPVAVKSAPINSLRPFATVCGSMPKIEAMCASPPWPSLSDSSPAYNRRCCSLSMLQNKTSNALASSVARSGLATIKEAGDCCKRAFLALIWRLATSFCTDRYTYTASKLSRERRASLTSWVRACLVLTCRMSLSSAAL